MIAEQTDTANTNTGSGPTVNSQFTTRHQPFLIGNKV